MNKKQEKAYLVNLGKRVRQLRKDKGLSQEELAERSKLHPTYIGGIERGERNPSIICLLMISEALDLKLPELLLPLSPSIGKQMDLYLEVIRKLEKQGHEELNWLKMVIDDVMRWRRLQRKD